MGRLTDVLLESSNIARLPRAASRTAVVPHGDVRLMRSSLAYPKMSGDITRAILAVSVDGCAKMRAA